MNDYNLPKDLPKGREEFDAWSLEVRTAAGCPINDSTNFALAVMVLHLGETDCDKPKDFFIRKLKKGMAAQVAAGVMDELKAKQEAERAKEKQDAEEAIAKGNESQRS